MEGWHLFAHAVRQVFGNFRAAVMISLVPMILRAVALLGLQSLTSQDTAFLQAELAAGHFPWAYMAGMSAISYFVAIWIAVGWHRYVLLEERPSWFPKIMMTKMLPYFGTTLLIFVIIFLAGVAVGAVFGVVAAVLKLSGVIVVVLTGTLSGMLALVVSFRLSTALPGIAIGGTTGLPDAWRVTQGRTVTFLVLSLLCACVYVMMLLPSGLGVPPASVLGRIMAFFTGWVFSMIMVSVLTTLYGHYIDKRALVYYSTSSKLA